MPNKILQFSGGKDSLACLYMARADLDSITVLYSDTGAAYPHVREFVVRTCADLGADLRIINPPEPIREYHRRMGVPADIVPVFNAAEYAWSVTGEARELVNPVMRCCMDMLLLPMQRYIADNAITTVIRGSKKSDARVGVPHGFVSGGVTYLSPLWDMTDDDVFSYLKDQGAEIPPHYAEVGNSLDCYLCSAHLSFDNGADRIAFTRKHYPALWPELRANLDQMRRVIFSELSAIAPAIEAAQ